MGDAQDRIGRGGRHDGQAGPDAEYEPADHVARAADDKCSERGIKDRGGRHPQVGDRVRHHQVAPRHDRQHRPDQRAPPPRTTRRRWYAGAGHRCAAGSGADLPVAVAAPRPGRRAAPSPRAASVGGPAAHLPRQGPYGLAPPRPDEEVARDAQDEQPVEGVQGAVDRVVLPQPGEQALQQRGQHDQHGRAGDRAGPRPRDHRQHQDERATPAIANPSARCGAKAAPPWSWRLNTPRPARKIWAAPASRKASSAHRYPRKAPRRSPVTGVAVPPGVVAVVAGRTCSGAPALRRRPRGPSSWSLAAGRAPGALVNGLS